jgi:hypothetical protein
VNLEFLAVIGWIVGLVIGAAFAIFLSGKRLQKVERSIDFLEADIYSIAATSDSNSTPRGIFFRVAFLEQGRKRDIASLAELRDDLRACASTVDALEDLVDKDDPTFDGVDWDRSQIEFEESDPLHEDHRFGSMWMYDHPSNDDRRCVILRFDLVTSLAIVGFEDGSTLIVPIARLYRCEADGD